MKVNWQRWRNQHNIEPKNFTCGYYGKNVESHTGYFNDSNLTTRIYICTFCGMPTLFFENKQFPGLSLGRTIQNLPEDVEQVCKEMRDTNKFLLHCCLFAWQKVNHASYC
jgi:hypothetical protein